ncbi:hypothetical protein KEJ27_09325 [Candidatus Bathyarchaeota archaeon]|nr:hypothetical protein [Candidatus Bathyarchaeota archaeon]MBS7612379.1 hypothetical protein [Candidatus Bathyarchaeota archaeon]MBS7617606.1 hypothetical protein [Candidatus Bathyarchaeota archaeon]
MKSSWAVNRGSFLFARLGKHIRRLSDDINLRIGMLKDMFQPSTYTRCLKPRQHNKMEK